MMLSLVLLIASTICHALSYDVVFKSDNSESPPPQPGSLIEGRFPPSVVNDKIDLKHLYETLEDNLQFSKRAPAAGFYGMRGRRVPGQSFYGMRGKKAPSGFMGMRGKKMESQLALDDTNGPLTFVPYPVAVPVDRTGGGGLMGLDGYWHPNNNNINNNNPGTNNLDMTKEAASLKKLLSGGGDSLTSDDHEESKRAPSQGFLGLRGKRASKVK